MNIVVTGGAGFIGCNFLRWMVGRYPEDRFINIDALTYAGNLKSLEDLEGKRNYSFYQVDICHRESLISLFQKEKPQAIVHFAAESHVDRSIASPLGFVETNVLGTMQLLDLTRSFGVERFVQISTDEVYGSLGPQGLFSEGSPLQPNSPYAASKASADLLVQAAAETYGMNTLITRCSNNYGPYQFPEKLIPKMIRRALDDLPLPVYGDGLNIRDWLYVEDHCRAIDLVLRKGRPGQVYNIGGSNEYTNLQIVQMILSILGKPMDLIQFVPDRPGHDRRYAMDADKISRELGWLPATGFEEGRRQTVDWYRQNEFWWRELVAKEMPDYL